MTSQVHAKLFHFLPVYTSERPMVMHQNKYEQVDDVNKRYIKETYAFFNRSNMLTSALMNIDSHMFEAAELHKRVREEQKTIPASKEKEWVNHPSHYNPGVYETINVIDAYNLNFYLATALRYILRAGKKHPEKYCEDLNKAIWYLSREVKKNSKS